MKFLIIDHYYPTFLTNFYSTHPDLATASYADQHRALMHEHFGTADFYSHGLRLAGHQARDVVANALPLQNAWAKEHCLPKLSLSAQLFDMLLHASSFWSSRKATLRKQQILYSQVLAYKPDVLYLHNISYLHDWFLQKLKPHVKLIIGQIAAPIPPYHTFHSFDLIITSLPHFVKQFRELGIKAEYLPLCFDPRILKATSPKNREYPVTFIGNFFKMHKGSEAALAALARALPIKIWGGSLDSLSDKSLKDAYHGEAWGNKMYYILKQSQITVNRHADVAGNYANNMRLFEATGCGAMLITDAKKNLSNFFVPDKEIVTYKTPQELVDKVQYYLSHPKERQKIARAGQARTLKDHTYVVRMQQLVSIIERYL